MIPPGVGEALEVANKLGILDAVVDLIGHVIKGDSVKARLSAEEAAIKAAARAPYLVKDSTK